MFKRWMGIVGSIVLVGCIAVAGSQTSFGQILEPGAPSTAPNPFSDPTAKPGKVLLFDLEARFAKDVADRGGAAFSEWFADDGVALGNGEAPVVGRVAIAKSANWSPKVYQLTWTDQKSVV